MAEQQRERLAENRDHLALDVATMRNRLQAERDRLQVELNEARRVWRNFATLMQQRRVRKPAAPPPSPRPVEKVPPSPMVKEVAPPVEKMPPDDLTTIRGIGARMNEHLNKAGIYTYAQLAASTPDELRRDLGAVARLAKVEEWIEQARELALG
jgi:predicted flap endonuclease-1-like 5' DNA nuclease